MIVECMQNACVCVIQKGNPDFWGSKGHQNMICPSEEKDNLVRKMWGRLCIKLSFCWQILNKN
jgi:hypothetical protein